MPRDPKFFGEPDLSFSAVLTRKLTIIYARVRSWPVIAKRLGISRQMLVYCRQGEKSPGHTALKKIDEEYFKCWQQLVTRTRNAKLKRDQRIAEGTLGLNALERQAELYLQRVDLTSRRQVNILRPDESKSDLPDQVAPDQGIDVHPANPETVERTSSGESRKGFTGCRHPQTPDHLKLNEPTKGTPAQAGQTGVVRSLR